MHTASSRFRCVCTMASAAAFVAAIALPCSTDARTIRNVAPAALNSPNSTHDPNDTPRVKSAGSQTSVDASVDALPVGRVIYAQLAQTIDVRKAKQGQPIAARVTLGVLSHGKVLVAEGGRITGRVTEVKVRSDDDPESVLGIVFDRAETVDGKELPLSLTVQAIGIGVLRSSLKVRMGAYGPYSAAPGPISTGNSSPTRGPEEDQLPAAETKPALDVGSKGMVGLKDLELTEGQGRADGSLVKSINKNVKLDSGWQLVLRVIEPKAAHGKRLSRN